jgi:hypothetical protein
MVQWTENSEENLIRYMMSNRTLTNELVNTDA